MDDVKRYDMSGECERDEMWMAVDATGDWVRHDDYAALRARLEAVEKERDDCMDSLEAALDQRDTADARAERAEAALALRNGECEAKKIIIAQLEAALATARRDARDDVLQSVGEMLAGTPEKDVSPAARGKIRAAIIRALANEAET